MSGPPWSARRQAMSTGEWTRVCACAAAAAAYECGCMCWVCIGWRCGYAACVAVAGGGGVLARHWSVPCRVPHIPLRRLGARGGHGAWRPRREVLAPPAHLAKSKGGEGELELVSPTCACPRRLEGRRGAQGTGSTWFALPRSTPARPRYRRLLPEACTRRGGGRGGSRGIKHSPGPVAPTWPTQPDSGM